MILLDRAREIAYEWHGGQSSPLYSFASAAKVHGAEHAERLVNEITEDIEGCMVVCKHGPRAEFQEQAANVWQLLELLDYVRSFER